MTEHRRALYRMLAPAEHLVLFIGEVHDTPMAAELYTRLRRHAALVPALDWTDPGRPRRGQPAGQRNGYRPHTWALVA